MKESFPGEKILQRACLRAAGGIIGKPFVFDGNTYLIDKISPMLVEYLLEGQISLREELKLNYNIHQPNGPLKHSLHLGVRFAENRDRVSALWTLDSKHLKHAIDQLIVGQVMDS